jgi:hypothetical protein
LIWQIWSAGELRKFMIRSPTVSPRGVLGEATVSMRRSQTSEIEEINRAVAASGAPGQTWPRSAAAGREWPENLPIPRVVIDARV